MPHSLTPLALSCSRKTTTTAALNAELYMCVYIFILFPIGQYYLYYYCIIYIHCSCPYILCVDICLSDPHIGYWYSQYDCYLVEIDDCFQLNWIY